MLSVNQNTQIHTLSFSHLPQKTQTHTQNMHTHTHTCTVISWLYSPTSSLETYWSWYHPRINKSACVDLVVTPKAIRRDFSSSEPLDRIPGFLWVVAVSCGSNKSTTHLKRTQLKVVWIAPHASFPPSHKLMFCRFGCLFLFCSWFHCFEFLPHGSSWRNEL